MAKILVRRGMKADTIRAAVQVDIRAVMQNYFIDQRLEGEGYQPVLPFFGCDEGGCNLPLAQGGTVIDPALPINFNDRL
jgi:hypothetical protein